MVVTFLCAAGLGPNCPQQTCLTFILREIMNNLKLHIDSLRKNDTAIDVVAISKSGTSPCPLPC
jgi:predicted ATPase